MSAPSRLRLVVTLVVAVLVAPAAGAAQTLRITHGISSGDPTPTSAVIWARANRPAQMVVDYVSAAAPAWPPRRKAGPRVGPATDFTGKVVLDGLAPATQYLYWVRFRDPRTGADVVSETGRFRTMPADGAAQPVTLMWWGDIGGQQICRIAGRGYALFDAMARVAADVAIASGDSVYADDICPLPFNVVSDDPEVAVHQLVKATDPRWTTPAQVLAAFRAKWKYNLEDDAYRRFRAALAHVYQWDDHDVINDWYPGERHIGPLRGLPDMRPMEAIARPGRRTLFEFSPIRPAPDQRIYRTVRLGKLAELFVLDLRSYRDDNVLPDRAGVAFEASFADGSIHKIVGKAKTMLGAAQREWLLRGLRDAQARGVVWKIIATNDSLAVPSGSYPVVPRDPAHAPYTVRDGWATSLRLNSDKDGNQNNPTGFESELRAILEALKSAGVTNTVWLSADVHHSRLLRYEPADNLEGFVFHEFVAGPVNAAALPAAPLSTTFKPVELYAGTGFLNFGVISIAEDGTLTAEIRDGDTAAPPDPAKRPSTLTVPPRR